MTANDIKVGDIVEILWPGSNSGVDKKEARIAAINRAGTKVGVNVARTTPRGEYTGGFGRSIRWFPIDEVLGVVR